MSPRRALAKVGHSPSSQRCRARGSSQPREGHTDSSATARLAPASGERRISAHLLRSRDGSEPEGWIGTKGMNKMPSGSQAERQRKEALKAGSGPAPPQKSPWEVCAEGSGDFGHAGEPKASVSPPETSALRAQPRGCLSGEAWLLRLARRCSIQKANKRPRLAGLRSPLPAAASKTNERVVPSRAAAETGPGSSPTLAQMLPHLLRTPKRR